MGPLSSCCAGLTVALPLQEESTHGSGKPIALLF